MSANENQTSTTGEPLKIIKTQLIPHQPLIYSPLHSSHSPTTTIPIQSSTANSNTNLTNLPNNPSLHNIHTHHNIQTAHGHAFSPIQLKHTTNSFSLNPVAAKITHVKTTTLDAGGGAGGINTGGGGITIGSIGGVAGNAIMSSGLGGSSATAIGTPISLNASQAATATAIRAIGTGGQSTQVRVVMPTGIMPQSMIKQFESTTGRTQITAIPTATARSVSNTSITVTRPIMTQTTYLPRAGVTAAQMTAGGMGMTTGQRLVTPIRATSTSGVGNATVTGLTAAGSFVRGATVSRNSNSPATTVISPASSTTWMAANTTGQVQLIRAIPHQPRQRTITTQGLSATCGGIQSGAVSGTLVGTSATVAQANAGQAPQQQGATSTIQMVSSQAAPLSQQQQTYVATLATVLPPRQHQTTLVYSSNVGGVTSQSLSQPQQFNPTIGTGGQRFAVATPLTGVGTAAGAPRQIRPISLGKSFSTAKLNTTSISIRTPIPQLTPTLATGVSGAGNVVNSAAAAAGNSPRSNTVTGGTTANVISTTNLSTTRIIQLQQQPGGTAQQIIGSTGRLTGNVMLHPIIVNASGTSKFGFRPPVTMAAKVQPSLTITQLGKLPSATSVAGAMSQQQQQQNITANIQTIGGNICSSVGGAIGSVTPTISTPSANITATNLTTAAMGGGSGAQMVTVSQGGATQLLTAQNIVSSATGGVGATAVPLAITTTRGPTGHNIIAGTITPIKSANAITVGKVMSHATQLGAASNEGNSGNVGNISGTPTSVYIHHAAAASHRPHNSGSGAATLAIASSNMPPATATTNSTALLTSSSVSGGTSFLPPGSTIYYESVPASSVQVSTGVLSLTTTTATSNTMTQNQISSANACASSNLAISSLPFSSHAAQNTTATFTVVPSSVGRTIGQLQIPVSNSGAQIQAVPVRFSAQLATAAATTTTAAAVGGSEQITVSQSLNTPQILHGPPISTNSGAGQQIIVPIGVHQHQSGGPTTGQQGQPMVIPLQTSIKVTSGGNSGTAVVSNYIRKRDIEGSPVRAAKNLGPTLLSMGTNIVNAVGSPAASSVGSAFSVASSAASSNTSSSIVLTAEALAKKERAAATATSTLSSSRADSPASSDGSTTVSANSSPGVDQQIQDGSMVVSRIPVGTSDNMHFNPIIELYSSHHHHGNMQHNTHGTPASSRNSSIDHQQQLHVSSSTQRLNGGPMECSTRKRTRRSTNDSQHSTQSQASLSLPPPSISSVAANSQYDSVNANSSNATLLTGPQTDANNTANNNMNHKANNQPATAGNKENAKPLEYVLRRPRNCTLLTAYKQNWKTANNHFQRYSDVKPREERRPTVIDLANQANILGKINGWKIHHLRSQMQDLCENESLAYEQLGDMLKQMETHESNADIERVNELLKGNMQRSKIIVDGIKDAENQIMKIFEHKSHISDIINRCASKRNFKKREKL